MVNTKEKEDSSMEEMRTEEKQIVYDQALYEKAYEYAKEKHGIQKRIGGEPYITHPVAVADILKKEGYDMDKVIIYNNVVDAYTFIRGLCGKQQVYALFENDLPDTYNEK